MGTHTGSTSYWVEAERMRLRQHRIEAGCDIHYSHIVVPNLTLCVLIHINSCFAGGTIIVIIILLLLLLLLLHFLNRFLAIAGQ